MTESAAAITTARHPNLAVPAATIKKILVVEDQPEIRKLIRMILNFDHYALHEASDAHMGLKMVMSLKPDLLLLDIMLPVGLDMSTPELTNGLDLCRMLKNMPAYAALPIILLTAKGQQADRAAGLAAGADEYLIKPFSPLHLTAIIESHLAKAKPA